MSENDKKLIISKRMKGEDGHKVFSVRIKDETVARLEELASKTNRSRNDLINLLLDYAIDHCEVQ
jgi:predicted transcriptional regulator